MPVTQPKFNDGETVRVVSSDNVFFGWQGRVICSLDLNLGQRHYQVSLFNFPTPTPLLFREIELAFGYAEPLPPPTLSHEEWEEIGQRMGWIKERLSADVNQVA